MLVTGKTSDFGSQLSPGVLAKVFVVAHVHRDHFSCHGLANKFLHLFSLNVNARRCRHSNLSGTSGSGSVSNSRA